MELRARERGRERRQRIDGRLPLEMMPISVSIPPPPPPPHSDQMITAAGARPSLIFDRV